ncbi:MAG: MBL fold metallo-hydrolase [Eubacteriales bacterium]|nr:MBL fold metallo-hydrolase [Eubacteriales bacterium]
MNKYYKTAKLSPGVIRIKGVGGEMCYLIQGTEAAYLIDSCTGYANLVQVVEALTSLPLHVGLTHGHCDHCGGAFFYPAFDMHPADLSVLQKHQSLEKRTAFIRTKDENVYQSMGGDAAFALYNGQSIRFLKHGDIINLGGNLKLEVYETPGHTKGSLCFVCRALHCAFSGDNVLDNTVLLHLPESADLQTYANSLRLLLALFEQGIDVLYTSHGCGTADHTLVQNLLQCCMDIQQNTDDKMPYSYFSIPCFLARRAHVTGNNLLSRNDGLPGNLAYPVQTN